MREMPARGDRIRTALPSPRRPAYCGPELGEKRLLRAARLNRDRDRFVEGMGVVPYRVVQGNDLWTIYRMIGKLEDRVYVIRA